MAFGSPDLPRIFVEAGYTCHAIETRFVVAGQKIVHPELMLCSEVSGHTLIIDAKSGANLGSDQLTRYSVIDHEALVKRAFTTQKASQRHSVLLIGQEQFAPRLLLGSRQVPSPSRVLAVTLDGTPTESEEPNGSNQQNIPFRRAEAELGLRGLKRIENKFGVRVLDKAFDPTLAIDWDVVPVSFLPIDHESADWEFAQYMLPEIIAAILNSTDKLRLDKLAENIIGHWNIIAADYRRVLSDRMRKILKLASQGRFASFLTFGAKKSSNREISLKVPDRLLGKPGLLRNELRRRSKDFMADLNSPQIKMLYED
jgi:hypothetical protein